MADSPPEAMPSPDERSPLPALKDILWWILAPVFYAGTFCFAVGPAFHYVYSLELRLPLGRGVERYALTTVGAAASFIALFPALMITSALFEPLTLVALSGVFLHTLAFLPFCLWIPCALSARDGVGVSIEDGLALFSHLRRGERATLFFLRLLPLPMAILPWGMFEGWVAYGVSAWIYAALQWVNVTFVARFFLRARRRRTHEKSEDWPAQLGSARLAAVATFVLALIAGGSIASGAFHSTPPEFVRDEVCRSIIAAEPVTSINVGDARVFVDDEGELHVETPDGGGAGHVPLPDAAESLRRVEDYVYIYADDCFRMPLSESGVRRDDSIGERLSHNAGPVAIVLFLFAFLFFAMHVWSAQGIVALARAVSRLAAMPRGRDDELALWSAEIEGTLRIEGMRMVGDGVLRVRGEDGSVRRYRLPDEGLAVLHPRTDHPRSSKNALIEAVLNHGDAGYRDGSMVLPTDARITFGDRDEVILRWLRPARTASFYLALAGLGFLLSTVVALWP